MHESAWQILGLALLLAAVTAAEIQFQRRRPAKSYDRLLRVVTLTTTAGGAIGAVAWWQAVPWSFSWALPPLAFKFLAAAGFAFAGLGMMTLLNPNSSQNRQFSTLIFVYLGPLTAVILARHLDQFDPDLPIVIAFFSIVTLLLAGSLAGMHRFGFRLQRPNDTGGLLVSALLLSWGGLLFLWPQGPIALIWPWASDPLTTRLVAAMFLTVAAAHWMSDTTQTRRSAWFLTLIYGAGITLGSILNLLQSKPAPMAYLAIWSAITAWSAFRLRQR